MYGNQKHTDEEIMNLYNELEEIDTVIKSLYQKKKDLHDERWIKYRTYLLRIDRLKEEGLIPS